MRGRGRMSRFLQVPGRGRMPQGDKPGSGPVGRCLCPSCEYTVTHARAVPCNTKVCPKCGARLTRE